MIRSLTIFFTTLLCLRSFVAASPAPGGSFVETTKSYRQEDAKRVASRHELQRNAHAWRGERVNWQILLRAGDEPVRAEVAASDLTSANGKLPAKLVRLDFLKFIRMNTRDRHAADPTFVEMVPDMLNGPGPVEVAANQLQPLWVGVDIPRDAMPGVYRGDISVKMNDASLVFPFAIKVLPVTVPEVKDWTFDVNFWMHPQATAHYYAGCKFHGQDETKWTHGGCAELMWSDRHLALYKPTLELLRDAGQKTITVNLVKDPWRSSYLLKSEQHQTNYPYDEMIRWRRKADGSYLFDFSAFEKFVKFCMDLGIDRRIECFSMLPWVSGKFSAITCDDEAAGKEIIHRFASWEEYDQTWSAFMREFVPLLVRNGWFEKTIIGADERGLGNMAHVQKVLEDFKHQGKPLRISAAANRTHPFDDSLDSISMHGGIKMVVNDKWSEKQFADWAEARRAKGLHSTWYTCTGTYPGNFGNSRPAESLFIGWYSARLKADGYLRWAVDSWNDTPTETTDHKVYETGDTFQLYPGDRDAKEPFTRSSVRFELFRQGVVDHEKIQVLKAKSPQSRQAIEAMLEKVSRPSRPPQINGNSSLQYDESTERDFADITEAAEKTLLEITLEAIQ
jgi:hypothetical protein